MKRDQLYEKLKCLRKAWALVKERLKDHSKISLLLHIIHVSNTYNMARSDVSNLQSPILRARAPEGEGTVN